MWNAETVPTQTHYTHTHTRHKHTHTHTYQVFGALISKEVYIFVVRIIIRRTYTTLNQAEAGRLTDRRSEEGMVTALTGAMKTFKDIINNLTMQSGIRHTVQTIVCHSMEQSRSQLDNCL